MSDAPVDPRNETISGESPAESVGPIAPVAKSDSAAEHAPRPVQFSLLSLLLITATCAVVFAAPAGVCAAPFLLITLGTYVYGVHRGSIEPSGLRLLFAGTTSALIVAIVHWTCWQEVSSNPTLFEYPLRGANDTLRYAREELEKYHNKHGEYPASLRSLPNAPFYRDANRECLDPWQNPIQYRRINYGYELFSFGRDGKQGGVGIDTDLDGISPTPPPTFDQYFGEMHAGRSIAMTAMLTGGAAFALYYWGTARPKGESPTRMRLLLNLVATVAMASIFAVIMALLEATPTGH